MHKNRFTLIIFIAFVTIHTFSQSKLCFNKISNFDNESDKQIALKMELYGINIIVFSKEDTIVIPYIDSTCFTINNLRDSLNVNVNVNNQIFKYSLTPQIIMDNLMILNENDLSNLTLRVFFSEQGFCYIIISRGSVSFIKEIRTPS